MGLSKSLFYRDIYDPHWPVRPQNLHVDYAYYLRGLAYFNKGNATLHRYIPDEISDETIVDLEELTAYHYECKSKSGAEEESYLTPFGDEH